MQKAHWSQTFIDPVGSPASTYYIQALDNADPSQTLAVYSDAAGNHRIANDIVRANSRGFIQFFGDGVYDFRVFNRKGTDPSPLSDPVVMTMRQVRLVDPAPVYDDTDVTTDGSPGAIMASLSRAQFGKTNVTNGTITILDSAAIYQVSGGSAWTEISSITTTGDYAAEEGRVYVFYFKSNYVLKTGSGFVVDGGVARVSLGTIGVFTYVDGKYRQSAPFSFNKDLEEYADYGTAGVNLISGSGGGGKIIIPAPVHVLTVGDANTVGTLRRIQWMTENYPPPIGWTITLIAVSDITFKDGNTGAGGLHLSADYNATTGSTITLVAAKVGTDVHWFEVSRSNNVTAPIELGTSDTESISSGANTYLVSGSGTDVEDPGQTLQYLTGGYDGQIITIVCQWPGGDGEDSYAIDRNDTCWAWRRKIDSGTLYSVSGSTVTTDFPAASGFNGTDGTIYLNHGDPFYMLPNDTLTLQRIPFGSKYYWKEIARNERTDMVPYVLVDSTEFVLDPWRRTMRIGYGSVGGDGPTIVGINGDWNERGRTVTLTAYYNTTDHVKVKSSSGIAACNIAVAEGGGNFQIDKDEMLTMIRVDLPIDPGGGGTTAHSLGRSQWAQLSFVTGLK